MNLQNRWGDNVEKDGGLLGPDGQPLASSPKTPPEEALQRREAEAEPQLDFFNYIASLGFQTMIFLGEMPNPITNQDRKESQASQILDRYAWSFCGIKPRVTYPRKKMICSMVPFMNCNCVMWTCPK